MRRACSTHRKKRNVWRILNLIKRIKPSNTTLGESQVTRYSVKLPGRHVSVCRDRNMSSW